jgi:hypothetical protein
LCAGRINQAGMMVNSIGHVGSSLDAASVCDAFTSSRFDVKTRLEVIRFYFAGAGGG